MEIEIIDLDELDEELEEKYEQERAMYDKDGYHKETGEYNVDYDAHYPNFDTIYKVEMEVLGKRTY